jgi:hypothetical protein
MCLLSITTGTELIPLGLDCEGSFDTATSSCRGLGARVVQGGLISLPSSVSVNDMRSPSHKFDFTLYADDTAISNVPQVDDALQLLGVITQRTTTVVE